jgi:toll-interacting protein
LFSLQPVANLPAMSYVTTYTTPAVGMMPMYYPQPMMVPVQGQPVYPPQQPQQPVQPRPPPQLTEEDMNQIKEMFPGMEDEVIKSVFEANRGNKDATINSLLSMTAE